MNGVPSLDISTSVTRFKDHWRTNKTKKKEFSPRMSNKNRLVTRKY